MLQQPQRSGENAAQSPREAGRRVREMLTTPKPTVVTDSTPTGPGVQSGRGSGRGSEGADGEPAPNNLLGLTLSCAQQSRPLRPERQQSSGVIYCVSGRGQLW